MWLALLFYLTLLMLRFFFASATEKCKLFGGESDSNVDLELLPFGATEKVSPFAYQSLVLIDVDDPDDECRHRLIASLTCELGHVELDFGSEAGGSPVDFPQKVEIGNEEIDALVRLRGESPTVCLNVKPDLKPKLIGVCYIHL